MMGEVVSVKVHPGDVVKPGQVVAILSAMKMEMAVQTQVAGKVNHTYRWPMGPLVLF